MRIFFSGIAGSGVSAIAGFMAEKGHLVAGSDRTFDNNNANELKIAFQSKGINIVRQDGSGIDDSYDFVVFSTAVEPDQPEFFKAKKLGITIKTRPEYLSEIASEFETVAVAGTSGKSTTSGLLAFLMKRLGLGPNFIGGGRVKQFKNSSNPGNFCTGDSDYLVIEACESDGSIVNYYPQNSIILNLDLDHNPVQDTAKMFETLARNSGKKVIINADDYNLKKMSGKTSTTFSIHNHSDYRAEEIKYESFMTRFNVNRTKFNLPLPGKHNLYNALSCIAFLSECGISLDSIAAVLPEFSGIDRRFDIHLDDGTHLVIDDYAHNPHKISYLMKTTRPLRDKICFIFQPHGYAPTRMLKNEYIKVFIENLRDSDHLILLPVYYTGGTAQKDISSFDLEKEINKSGKSAEVIAKREDILEKISEYDTYIIFGARDETLSSFAEKISRSLQQTLK